MSNYKMLCSFFLRGWSFRRILHQPIFLGDDLGYFPRASRVISSRPPQVWGIILALNILMAGFLEGVIIGVCEGKKGRKPRGRSFPLVVDLLLTDICISNGMLRAKKGEGQIGERRHGVSSVNNSCVQV